jgi:hypothetical protein
LSRAALRARIPPIELTFAPNLPLCATGDLFWNISRRHRLCIMDIDRIRALYPTLSEDEVNEAKDRLERYFECALSVARGTNSLSVDKSDDPFTIKERSISSLTDIPFEHG